MADDGFDFHAPPRREAKRFEPPPWEQDAFDELERKRAEQQEAEQVAREALAQPAVGPPTEAELQAAASAAAAARPAQGQQSPTVQAAREKPAGEAGKLDESTVTAMLAELSGEEPRALEGLWKVAIAAAIVLGAIGAVLIVWAIAAFLGVRRTGAVGAGGGAVLLFFGTGFVAGAWWLTFRTLRDRGVL